MASEISLQGYEILEKLGEGGMAEVFLARQVSLDRKVVIKKLLTSRQDVERIRKEGLILSKLNHPNIVTVYDLIEENGGFYLVEEYLEGVTLRQYLEDCIKENESIPFDSFSKLAGQIIEGVECAHAKGVIHRDLKPENIVILEDGRVKICDFGISAFDTQAVSSTYKIAGTLEYMPPELFDDNPQITVLGDYYSLGCIFYEMITLKRPFGFTDKTGLMTVIKRKTTTTPDLNVEINEEYRNLFTDIQSLVSIVPGEREKALTDLSEHIKMRSSEKTESEVSKTKSIIGSDLKKYINQKNKNSEAEIKGYETNLSKLYQVSAYISFTAIASPIAGLLAFLIGLLFVDFNLPVYPIWPFVIVAVFGGLFLVSVFISIIFGMIFIQKKEKHGWFMLIIPIVDFILAMAVFSIGNIGPVLSIFFGVVAYAFYFYLWYFFAKKINAIKPILKATLISLIIVFLVTGICFGLYQLHIYNITRLTSENLKGTWRAYNSETGESDYFYFVFIDKSNMKMVFDDNENGIFENKEIHTFYYQILSADKVKIGKRIEDFVIEFPKKEIRTNDSGFLKNGRILLNADIDEKGVPYTVHLQEYKNIF